MKEEQRSRNINRFHRQESLPKHLSNLYFIFVLLGCAVLSNAFRTILTSNVKSLSSFRFSRLDGALTQHNKMIGAFETIKKLSPLRAAPTEDTGNETGTDGVDVGVGEEGTESSSPAEDEFDWDPKCAPKMDFDEDYYSVLEVDPTVNARQLKKGYYKIVFTYHPDRKNETKEKELANKQMMVINGAYRILKAPETRAEYDRAREMGLLGGNSGVKGSGRNPSKGGSRGGSASYTPRSGPEYKTTRGGRYRSVFEDYDDMTRAEAYARRKAAQTQFNRGGDKGGAGYEWEAFARSGPPRGTAYPEGYNYPRTEASRGSYYMDEESGDLKWADDDVSNKEKETRRSPEEIVAENLVAAGKLRQERELRKAERLRQKQEQEEEEQEEYTARSSSSSFIYIEEDDGDDGNKIGGDGKDEDDDDEATRWVEELIRRSRSGVDDILESTYTQLEKQRVVDGPFGEVTVMLRSLLGALRPPQYKDSNVRGSSNKNSGRRSTTSVPRRREEEEEGGDDDKE